MIHGVDVARAILAVHRNGKWDEKGERWLLTDMRVYDWWDLASAWGDGGRGGGHGAPVTGEQPKWVIELMQKNKVSTSRTTRLIEYMLIASIHVGTTLFRSWHFQGPSDKFQESIFPQRSSGNTLASPHGKQDLRSKNDCSLNRCISKTRCDLSVQVPNRISEPDVTVSPVSVPRCTTIHLGCYQRFRYLITVEGYARW